MVLGLGRAVQLVCVDTLGFPGGQSADNMAMSAQSAAPSLRAVIASSVYFWSSSVTREGCPIRTQRGTPAATRRASPPPRSSTA